MKFITKFFKPQMNNNPITEFNYKPLKKYTINILTYNNLLKWIIVQIDDNFTFF